MQVVAGIFGDRNCSLRVKAQELVEPLDVVSP